MRKFPTGDRIADIIKDSEDRIDALIGEAAALLSEVTAARVSMGEDAILAQRPIARAVGFQNILLDARRKLTGLHSDLARIAAAAKDMPVGCNCITSDEVGVAQPS